MLTYYEFAFLSCPNCTKTNFFVFHNFFLLNFALKDIYLWMFPDWDQSSDSESNWSLPVDVKIFDVFSVPIALATASLDVDNF